MNASCMSEDMFAKLKHLLSIHYSRYFFLDLIENVLLVKSDICNFISVKLLCSANNNDLFCYAWSYHALINFPMFYTMLRYNFFCYANLCKFMQCNVLLCCALLCNEMITYHFLFYPIFCYIKHYMCCAHATRLLRVCLCYHVPQDERQFMQEQEKLLEIEVRYCNKAKRQERKSFLHYHLLDIRSHQNVKYSVNLNFLLR